MRTITDLLALDNPDAFSYDERVEIVEQIQACIDQEQKTIQLYQQNGFDTSTAQHVLTQLQQLYLHWLLIAATPHKFGIHAEPTAMLC